MIAREWFIILAHPPKRERCPPILVALFASAQRDSRESTCVSQTTTTYVSFACMVNRALGYINVDSGEHPDGSTARSTSQPASVSATPQVSSISISVVVDSVSAVHQNQQASADSLGASCSTTTTPSNKDISSSFLVLSSPSLR